MSFLETVERVRNLLERHRRVQPFSHLDLPPAAGRLKRSGEVKDLSGRP